MKTAASVIDSHAHLGIQDTSFNQSFAAYRRDAASTPIEGVAAFPPVYEIYDRYDPGFTDTPEWQQRRERANAYLLEAGSRDLFVIPYFFIWNDFRVDQLTSRHKGIKWHRHASEPRYEYHKNACKKALAEIQRRHMPVVFEEEFRNTVMFIEALASDIRVIIPHLGGLNGGYRAIARQGLWERPHVYTDTALASPAEIYDYIENFGHERILFGSDFPFGDPASEFLKIERMKLPPAVKSAITGDNIKRLLADSNT